MPVIKQAYEHKMGVVHDGKGNFLILSFRFQLVSNIEIENAHDCVSTETACQIEVKLCKMHGHTNSHTQTHTHFTHSNELSNGLDHIAKRANLEELDERRREEEMEIDIEIDRESEKERWQKQPNFGICQKQYNRSK